MPSGWRPYPARKPIDDAGLSFAPRSLVGTYVKVRQPNGFSSCSCGCLPGLTIWYGDRLPGFAELGRLLEVVTACRTASAQNDNGAHAQSRMLLTISDTTSIARSAKPRWLLASGGLGSWVMECSCSTCRKALELKSGPLSVRTNLTDVTLPAGSMVPCLTMVRRKLSKTAATSEGDLTKRTHLVLV